LQTAIKEGRLETGMADYEPRRIHGAHLYWLRLFAMGGAHVP